MLYTVIGILGFCLLFSLMFVSLYIAHWNSREGIKNSLAYFYILRVAGAILIFLRKILYLSFLIILLTTTTCSYITSDGSNTIVNYDCGNNIQTALLACSAFILVLILFLYIFSIIFFADEQPDSKLPWAYCSRMLEIYKLLRKTILAVGFYQSFGSSSFGSVCTGFAALMTILNLYELYKQVYMNHVRVFWALATSELTVLWITIAAFLQMQAQICWGSPEILIILMVIFFASSMLANKHQRRTFCLRKSIASISESTEVETYCRLLLESLKSSSQSHQIFIEGFIGIHNSKCNRPNCPCNDLKNIYLEGAEEQSNEKSESGKYLNKDTKKLDYQEKSPKSTPNDEKGLVNKPQDDSPEVDTGENDKRIITIYKILIDELCECNQKQNNKARLHIYLAYLKLFCYDNKLAALYELMCAQDALPNLYEGFIAFRLM